MTYRVPDEFIIERQGKKMVLSAGLLDAAHHQGLRGIDTELVQIPTPDNGQVAIVKATIEIQDPDDMPAGTRSFSGIGDASPDNVARNIAPHVIRMAETRAKNRALRDAVDIGGMMVLEDSATEVVAPSKAPEPAPALPEKLASKEKQDYLKELIEQLGVENGLAQFELKHGAISTFSPEKADDWIDHF